MSYDTNKKERNTDKKKDTETRKKKHTITSMLLL